MPGDSLSHGPATFSAARHTPVCPPDTSVTALPIRDDANRQAAADEGRHSVL